MRSRLLRLPALLIVAAACGESTDLDRVDTVRVTPRNPFTEEGLSVQFEAEALDAAGELVPGIPFQWSSSDTSVAAIDDMGLAIARTAGTSAITASAGSATPGSAVVVVEASRCLERTEVSLTSGEYETYAGNTCLLLPSGIAGDRYRVALTRPTLIEDPDDVPTVWLRISPILTAEEQASAERSPAPTPTFEAATGGAARSDGRPRLDGTRFLADVAVLEHTRRFHRQLRERERQLGLLTRGVMATGAARANGPAGAPPASRDDLFLVLDCDSSEGRTPVVLVDFNDDLAIYQDSVGHQTDPLNIVATQMMLDYYSDHVRDLADQYWGQTPDTDGNERVILTTSGALPDSAAAAVYSGDFASTSSCPTSNEGEVMYFSSEIIQNMVGSDPSYIGLSIMAHELKHVTSLHNGLARGAFHPTWIEEGTAEIAQVMSSRAAWASIGGPPVGSRLEVDDILDAVDANDGEVLPEMWAIVSEVADLIVALSTQPNSLVTNPEGAAEFHTFYSSGWHWHRFIGDAWGNASSPFADAQLFRTMTDSLTPAGANALTAVTGRSFDQLYEDMTVAMSLHRVGPEPARTFTTWDLIGTTALFAGPPEVAPPHEYPWPVTASLGGNPSATFRGAVYSCPLQISGENYRLPDPDDRCPIGPSGIRFHDFVSEGIGVGAQVQVFGAPGSTITITRIR